MAHILGVSGAGGFIGGHLVDRFVNEGYDVRAIDRKPYDQWFNVNPKAHNVIKDVATENGAAYSVRGCSEFYNLAADMGGIGHIETHKADCMMSVLSTTQPIKAAQVYGVDKYFYSSSACVYAADKQTDADVTALKEEDAYPAMPEDGYGWEKLFGERMAWHFYEDYGLETRVARFHNVYGPRTHYEGGREKAPAAICRKVIEAMENNDYRIEIWGDGEQSRSFMYVDDCVEGIIKIMHSDYHYPLNLGSSELVTINQLVDMVEGIAGVQLERRYNLDAPKGVRGRNSDNTLIQEVVGWEPSISLQNGLEKTFAWVYNQITNNYW